MSECYVSNIPLFVFGGAVVWFFCPRQIWSPSSVSSVENDKRLVMLEMDGPQFENSVEVWTFFFLHTTFSMKETLYVYWYCGQSRKQTCPYFEYPFSCLCWGHTVPLIRCEAHRLEKPGRPPANVLLPGGHLGCLCPRCFCLGNLRSLGSRLPWIRHTFWKGPDMALLYQGFLPLTSFYWLMWARVLVSSWYSSSLPIWPRSKESNWFRMFLGIIEDTLETPIKC